MNLSTVTHTLPTETEDGEPAILIRCKDQRRVETLIYLAPYPHGHGPEVGDQVWFKGADLCWRGERPSVKLRIYREYLEEGEEVDPSETVALRADR